MLEDLRNEPVFKKNVVQLFEKTLLGLLSTTLASSYLESLTLVRR